MTEYINYSWVGLCIVGWVLVFYLTYVISKLRDGLYEIEKEVQDCIVILRKYKDQEDQNG